MKAGTLLCCGNANFMAGYMMYGGRIIILGDSGEKVALLGQSFMPAQSFQVLRPSRDRTWFSLADEDGVQTPFWRRFPWSSLRRLDDA